MQPIKYKVPYGGMLFGDEERKALHEAIERNYWPLGEEGKLMEREAADFLGVKHGLLANSGSSAGLLALSALELPKGSEVIIPATTFPTIFNIILQCGLVPVVIDSKLGTYNLAPEDVELAIGPNTRAIIAVHAVGNPCDMKALMEIANKHKIYVIEDNCDGWGGSINGKRVGSFGHLSFTSFHAAHIVSMGQGGGIFTDDDELARKVRMYRDWGRQSDIDRRTNGDKWPDLPADQDARFIYEKVGYNLGPLDIQAAMGRVQLRRTEEIKAKRKTNFEYLYEHLSKYPLVMPTWVEGADPSWFAMPLAYHDRAPLVAHLEANGIETRSMFAGNILRHPAYKDVVHRDTTTINSECNKVLTDAFWIGVHPRMTQEDREYVVKVFDNFFANVETA